MATVEERHADAHYVIVAQPPAPKPPERSADKIAQQVKGATKP